MELAFLSVRGFVLVHYLDRYMGIDSIIFGMQIFFRGSWKINLKKKKKATATSQKLPHKPGSLYHRI